MGSTPALGLTYPALADQPDGAGQIERLATDVDGAIQTGVASIVVNGTTTANATVTFPRPFAAGAVPVVVASTSNGYYVLSSSAPTNTGVTLTARDIRGTAGSATVTVRWIAVGMVGA